MTQEWTFHRDEELEALRARLRKRRSLLVHGPMGVGKTLLLKRLLREHPQMLYSSDSAAMQPTFRNLALALLAARDPAVVQAVGARGAEGLNCKSAVALRGIVIDALRKRKYYIVLDHLKLPSQSFAAAVREITDWSQTPMVAVARSTHMEDTGFLHSLFAERTDRFELRNFPKPEAKQFAQECVRRAGLSAQNLGEFIERVLEFSAGNPGAILSMLEMAQRPEYRSAEHVKITPLYVDFRLNLPLGYRFYGQ